MIINNHPTGNAGDSASFLILKNQKATFYFVPPVMQHQAFFVGIQPFDPK